VVPPNDIATAAFNANAWRSSIDALYEATGLVISVVDSAARSTVHTTSTCEYCELVSPGGNTSSPTCLDEAPDIPSAETTRTQCRGGLPCYVTPVSAHDEVCCHVVMGGFVSSTRDRKRIFERLLGRGISETKARTITRDIPVLTQREVEALARMTAVNAAETVRHATSTNGSGRRLHESEAFADAAHEFAGLIDEQTELHRAVLAHGARLIDADAGALMVRRSHTGVLEVVDVLGGERDLRVGLRVGVGQGIEGRVAKTRRSVLVSADSESGEAANGGARVSVPIENGEDLLGVLTVGTNGSRKLVGDEVRVLERYAAMASTFLSSASESTTLHRTVEEQTHLTAYSKELSATSGIDEVIEITAGALGAAFEFDVAGLAILGWGRDEVGIIVHGDVPADALDAVLEQAVGRDIEAEPFEFVAHTGQTGQIVPPAGDPDQWTAMAVEVMMRDTLVGYLFIAGHRPGMFDGSDRRLLGGMADYTAAALEKASLFARLRDDYAKTIAALGAALDLGERKEFGHSDRVMDYAVAIGEELGLPHDEIETLRFAGLLHDIGKVGISEEILLKPSRLTRIEMEKMRRHAEFGAGILEQIEFLDALAPVIMHHHERWDGEGYPVGLKGSDIPLLARILAVADAYDAMTSERVYDEPRTARDARKELREAAGSQFDPRIVSAFMSALDAQARAGATGLLSESSQAAQDQLPS
jgi:putative nucleotidyltransferase with HDIG domain